MTAEYEREPDCHPDDLIVVDGYTVNKETGEVYGRSDCAPGLFVIDSDDKADWVLQKRMDEESEINAINARIQALTDNLRSMRKEHENRLQWLEFRFDDELTEYAKTKLTDKSKTAKFAYGKVSFRTSAGTNKILDMDAAVAYAEASPNPEIVKVTKSVNVSDLKENFDLSGLPFIESSGPKETVTIATGLEKN